MKSALRILLPTVKANLVPRPLASLLCLDWVNEELGLGLDIEKDGETQLASGNIATFILDCACLSAAGSVTLGDIESSRHRRCRPLPYLSLGSVGASTRRSSVSTRERRTAMWHEVYLLRCQLAGNWTLVLGLSCCGMVRVLD